MPRVLNKYVDGFPSGSKNIMRGTPWGNPFVVGKHGTREECVEKFCAWVCDQPDLIERARRELRGCDLVCCCSPRLCHGHIWIEIIN
jgi:hypothetical protein